MSAVIVLIGVSLLVAAGFLGAFIWAVRSDQYRDTVSPAYRALFDGDESITREPAQTKEKDFKSLDRGAEN